MEGIICLVWLSIFGNWKSNGENRSTFVHGACTQPQCLSIWLFVLIFRYFQHCIQQSTLPLTPAPPLVSYLIFELSIFPRAQSSYSKLPRTFLFLTLPRSSSFLPLTPLSPLHLAFSILTLLNCIISFNLFGFIPSLQF